jgi:hypothetical protein
MKFREEPKNGVFGTCQIAPAWHPIFLLNFRVPAPRNRERDGFSCRLSPDQEGVAIAVAVESLCVRLASNDVKVEFSHLLKAR